MFFDAMLKRLKLIFEHFTEPIYYHMA